MKRNILIFSVFALIALMTIRPGSLISHAIYPPADVCNAAAPPDTPITCAQSGCHPCTQSNCDTPAYSPSNPDILTLLIDTSPNFVNNISLNDSFQYAGNTTYYIKFKITSNTGVYGFQIIPQDVNNNMAGSFTVVNRTDTKIITTPPTGSRQYMGHLQANDTTTYWVFQWTSPAASTGQITFYYAYNTSTLAFLDSITSPGASPGVPGGEIYAGTAVILPLPTGINDLPPSVSGLNLFPNPTDGNFGILFDLKQSETVGIAVYSLDGRLSKQLVTGALFNAGSFSQSFNLSELPAGIYLLRFNIGNSTVTRKLIKL
jgi:hypothetical protein